MDTAVAATVEYTSMGQDVLDVSLHDGDLRDEVEWTASLMIAANESDGPLTQRSIDEILGLVPRPAVMIRQRIPLAS